MHRMQRVLLVSVLAMSCAACSLSTRTGAAAIETELYFGLSIAGGGEITPEEWEAFVDEVVIPRFPDGFTVVRARGQWRPSSGGASRSEPSRVLVLIHDGCAESDRKLREIVDNYKSKFDQESVLRVDGSVHAEF